MLKKLIAVFLLILSMLTMCSCESELEKAQRELDAATQRANEAKEHLKKMEEYLYGR